MSLPNYRKLTVWVKAHGNALKAIQLTTKVNKRYEGIVKQFLSAITSVGANIAEGSGGYKDKEFVRFLNIALRSAFETDNWVQLLKDSELTNDPALLKEIQETNLEVIKMLISLVKSQTK